MPKVVLDTSIVISGKINEIVESGGLRDSEVIIPEAVVDELQSQASQKKEQGLIGLEEIKKLKLISGNYNLTVRFDGKRPTFDDVQLSERGRIDAMIKDVALANGAVLYTADRVQSMVAEAEGIEVQLATQASRPRRMEFLRFFDETTMSVHLKEGLNPMAKRGRPGSFELATIEEKPLTREYLHRIATDILEAARSRDSGVEVSLPGALVVQHEDYRVAITQPPFSEKYEITIVHPIVRLSLDHYTISEKLMERFSKKAEGVLISGPPGSGKSTLASGLANFYHGKGRIVKTFESPRDLQVEDGITQYTRLDGSFENSADILLLVRPDYTVFDEVRRSEDFGIFSDLRLTGVGMIGVVHANGPLDAIQRFIGKIELGIIPSVLDTVVFVRDGAIAKVYELELKVKVPSGMVEQDLARPVIEIRDFESQVLEYEIYTFGEENVIVPVTETKDKASSGIAKLAGEKIRETFRRFDPGAKVEILSENRVKVMVKKRHIPAVIGRAGSNINELQKTLGMHIDVVESAAGPDGDEGREEPGHEGRDIQFELSETKNFVTLDVDRDLSGKQADIYANGSRFESCRIGRKGQIKVPKRSGAGRRLSKLVASGDPIRLVLRDF